MLLGDDEQDLDRCHLSILDSGSELPLLERAEQEFRLCKLLRKNNGQVFEVASYVDKAMDHDGIGVEIVRDKMRSYDEVRPGCIGTSTVHGSGFHDTRKRILEYPIFRSAYVQINGVCQPAGPYCWSVRILIRRRRPHHHDSEMSVLRQVDAVDGRSIDQSSISICCGLRTILSRRIFSLCRFAALAATAA